MKATVLTESDYTVVQQTIYWNYITVARMLIHHGANWHFADRSSETPLTAAAKLETASVLKDLLEKGADYTQPAEYGWNPLMVAAYRNHLEAARALLKAGASPTSFGRYPSETPLHFARRQNHREMVALLEEADRAETDRVLPFANGM